MSAFEAARERARERREAALNEAGLSAQRSSKAPPTLATSPTCTEFCWNSKSSCPEECAQVSKGLWVGSARAITREHLQKIGASHILSLTQLEASGGLSGVSRRICILDDDRSCDMYAHFREESQWLDAALRGGGVSIIHCSEGISRAPAMAMAYLILSQGFSLVEAMRAVRAARPVARPNQGFMQQLCRLEMEVHRSNTMAVDGCHYYCVGPGAESAA